MTSLRGNTSNTSSSASQSPLTPVVEITRLRTPTQIPAVTVKREEGANEEIKEFAETAMNELLGWYGYGTDTAKRNGQQSVDPEDGSASGVSITKKDSLPRNRQPRAARVNEAAAAARYSPPSLSNSPQTTSRASPGGASIENNLERSCDWCHRKINQEETFGTTEGVRFCSESCFSQSRRATFKRAKTCDWCRHVRHAVSYVDFQDGASQLQFCSDKCLNQYKMQIFIKETQAHLEMNPHLMQSEASGGSLITPELWLKNCRSRSASPEQFARSRSPSPNSSEKDVVSCRRTDLDSSSLPNRPTITIAPVSKLLPPPPPAPIPQSASQTTAEMMANRPSMKTMRKRRTLRNGPPVRDNTSSYLQRPPEETSHQVSPGGAKNPFQPEAPARSAANGLQPQMHLNQFDGRFLSPPPNLFPIRHHLVPPGGGQGPASSAPQMFRVPTEQNTALPPLPNLRPASMNREHNNNYGHPTIPNFFSPGHFMGSHVPPVTILVPCPIIMPIPVPIPIPINMPEFLLRLLDSSAATAKSEADGGSAEDHSQSTGTAESDLNNNNTRNSSTAINYSMQNESVEDKEDVAGDDSESSGQESCEVVPKIKITRLQSKRILTSRELDSTRPLRKRKVDAYT